MGFRAKSKLAFVAVVILLSLVVGCKKYGRSPRNPVSLNPNSISKPVESQKSNTVNSQ